MVDLAALSAIAIEEFCDRVGAAQHVVRQIVLRPTRMQARGLKASPSSILLIGNERLGGTQNGLR